MRASSWLALVVALWLLHAGEARARPDDLRAKVVRHATPTRLCPGEATRVAVTLLNTGAEPWSPQTKDRLAYHWRDAQGEIVVRDGERTELSQRVGPGESVQLEARLLAPPSAGPLTLEWKLVREGVRWVPTVDGRTPVTVVDADRPALALGVVAGAPTQAVAAGAAFTVEVTVDNLGCAAWSPETADNLAYHWYAQDGQLVEFDGRRTPLPAMLPGAQAQVLATVMAPPQPGQYQLQWAMVREGLGWVEVDPEASSWPRQVQVGPPPLSWGWQPIDPIPELAAGQVVTISLSLSNTGTEAWRADAGDRLGYRWLDEAGQPLPDDGLRTLLPATVPPGATVVLDARLTAPPRPGRFSLAWEPVREHVRWFGAPSTGPDPVVVTVMPARLAWALQNVDDPGPVWVGRETTMRVTIHNDGADTWSDATADHLSYRFVDADGQLVDEGVRTALPHDVAPGQTVTLDMRVRGPADPGAYTLQIEMVREHVAWFGPPTRGVATLRVVASRVAVGLSIALVFMTVGGLALRRQPRLGTTAGRGTRLWIAERIALPLWATVAVGLAGEVFVELGGVPAWEGGAEIAWSCAAFAGLVVAVLPVRAQRWGVAGVAWGATALVVADLAYLEFFGSIVPLTALSALHHLGDAHGTVWSLLAPQHLWLLILPAASLLLAVAWGPPATAPARGLRWRVRAAVVLLAALAGTHAVRQLIDELQGKLGARVFSQHNNVGRFGLLGAHAFEVGRQLRDALHAPQPPQGASRQALDAFFADRAARRDAGTPVRAKAAGYNLVILQVEALSSWARGLVIDGQPVTPFLDAAAGGQAWLSLSIYDQTAQGRTSDAEYLVLSSGHPLAEGALSFRHDGNDFFTLVHALQARGYASLSAHPYARGFWNRAVLHPRYGFADSMFRRELGPGPVVGWGLSDGAFLARMVEPIAALPEPWVTFMITLSLHHPYDAFPDALSELELGALSQTAVGNYLQAMRHFDTSLAIFMEALASRGLADHTIVAVYGDHVTGIESRRAVWSLAGWDAWTPDLPVRIHRVPLLVWAPGVPAPSVDPDEPFGQIDIGPTLLDLLGVPAPPASVGVSVAARGVSRPVVLPDGSAVAADRLFVASGRDVPRQGACFDLPSGTTRPRNDCDVLAAAARDELSWSRAVVEHDLHRDVGPATP